MGSSEFSAWPQYLTNPLALVGFAIMLFASIIIALLKSKFLCSLTRIPEQISKLVIMYAFIVIFVVVLGFGLAFMKARPGEKSFWTGGVIQTTTGKQSPAVVIQGKDASIKIKYENTSNLERAKTPEEPARQGNKNIPDPPQQNIRQQTEGAQSPAVVAGGDVTIKFNGKRK